MPRSGRAARRKQKRDQRKGERRRTGEGRTMDGAALVLTLLSMTWDRRAVCIAKADLEARRTRTDRKLRRNRPGEHGMQHERIGRDPADELARRAQSLSRRCHPALTL